jgi:hypothetical protein
VLDADYERAAVDHAPPYYHFFGSEPGTLRHWVPGRIGDLVILVEITPPLRFPPEDE